MCAGVQGPLVATMAAASDAQVVSREREGQWRGRAGGEKGRGRRGRGLGREEAALRGGRLHVAGVGDGPGVHLKEIG